MTTGFSIIIPTYNRVRLLKPTLESVKKLKIPDGSDVELLVIDNNCTDDTARIVEDAAKDRPFSITRILESQQGLCFGRNRGLQEAQFDHVIYLDDDIDIAPDWLHGYIEAVETLNADCVVGPVTPRFESEIPQYFTQRVVDSISSPYSRKGDVLLLLPVESAHEVPGCNFGFRKSVGLEIGGFNNSLDRVGKALLSGGDFEFGMRLAAAGKRVVYQPRCAIEHVIDAEKLTASYMRKRWTGAGATGGVLHKSSEENFTRRMRYRAGAARLLAACAFHRFRGNSSLAFQRELEARRSFAFVNTRLSLK